MHRKIHVLPAKNARAIPHNSHLTAQAPLRRLRHGICVAKMLDKTSSIICAFGLASAAPRSPYRHLELCGIALSFLSTEITGGFTGCTVGMYASANGTAGTNHAAFYWFAYQQV